MLDRANLAALMKQVAKADPSAPVSYRAVVKDTMLRLVSSSNSAVNLYMMR